MRDAKVNYRMHKSCSNGDLRHSSAFHIAEGTSAVKRFSQGGHAFHDKHMHNASRVASCLRHATGRRESRPSPRAGSRAAHSVRIPTDGWGIWRRIQSRSMSSPIAILPPGHLRPLCRSERGVVLGCPDCGALQLQFGNVVLALAPEDLDALLATMAELEGADAAVPPPTIYLTENGFGVRFSRAEVREVRQLLDSARALRLHHLLGVMCATPHRCDAPVH